MAAVIDPKIYPSVPTTPKLIPVFTINLKFEKDPDNIFENSQVDKALSLARLINGEIKTVENQLGFELEAVGITGFDDLNARPSLGAATLDCKLYGKTPNGAGVYITYGGVVQFTEASTSVISGKSNTSEIDDSYVTCNPSFQFDSKVEDKYKWVLKENLFGKGRFVRGSDGVLYVQYFIYVFR
ncbi:uncharacterized protein RJT20DRAFT_125641 [Scheffersomyces xylosifermentans]|uniref:uncharacterized protein n=1 Tax=Scheffersomyces xylosifermentans TaxID=1304137 RepID=UPI00315DDAB6